MKILVEKHIYRDAQLRKDVIAITKATLRNRKDDSILGYYIATALDSAGCGKYSANIKEDVVELRNLDRDPEWKIAYDDTPKPKAPPTKPKRILKKNTIAGFNLVESNILHALLNSPDGLSVDDVESNSVAFGLLRRGYIVNYHGRLSLTELGRDVVDSK